ncbi:MAG: lysylphosphatidylglycerol synthase transmembrane domain-containing protein [Polyangiaceae bacterium]|nr:lysylphosphatidylglycerol synthase transmembrane domain-containing protein [Polyangiaceae bacterium]
MKNLVTRLLVAVLLGVLLYGAFVLYTGYSKIAQSLVHFHWSAFALALALATTNYLLRFLKWEYYLARLNIRGIPKIDSLLAFLSGFVLTITPGKIGEVFKSAVLSETHQVPAARTAPIVFAERLTDVIGVVLLILLGSVGFSGGLPWALAGLAAVGVGLVIVIWPKPLEWVLARIEKSQGKLVRFAPKLRDALVSLRLVAAPSALLWPALLSVVGWGLEGLALSTLLNGFGLEVPLARAVFFYATATLAGAIIPVPGGLGVTEAMLHEQMVHLGAVTTGAATASMMLIRFATLWWAVFVGFVALFFLKLKHPTLFAGKIPEPDEIRVPGAH